MPGCSILGPTEKARLDRAVGELHDATSADLRTSGGDFLRLRVPGDICPDSVADVDCDAGDDPR